MKYLCLTFWLLISFALHAQSQQAITTVIKEFLEQSLQHHQIAMSNEIPWGNSLYYRCNLRDGELTGVVKEEDRPEYLFLANFLRKIDFQALLIQTLKPPMDSVYDIKLQIFRDPLSEYTYVAVELAKFKKVPIDATTEFIFGGIVELYVEPRGGMSKFLHSLKDYRLSIGDSSSRSYSFIVSSKGILHDATVDARSDSNFQGFITGLTRWSPSVINGRLADTYVEVTIAGNSLGEVYTYPIYYMDEGQVIYEERYDKSRADFSGIFDPNTQQLRAIFDQNKQPMEDSYMKDLTLMNKNNYIFISFGRTYFKRMMRYR